MIKRIFALLLLILLIVLPSCTDTDDVDQSTSSSENEDRSNPDDNIISVDITQDLEYLGINAASYWNDSAAKYIFSRNPYDMITVGDKVLVSGGNYGDNTGPVPIYAYSSDSDDALKTGVLDTEQVNRFYDCGEYIVALAIDPKTWQVGGLYFYDKAEEEWIIKSKVLRDNIHCYDIAEHNGNWFLCGSNCRNKNIFGSNTRLSKAVIFRTDGEISPSLGLNDYKEVDIMDRYGNVVDYETILREYQGNYYIAGVPRFYDMFEFKGELYAFYYNPYYKSYSDIAHLNGFYRYDDEKDQFIYDESLDSDGILTLLTRTKQDEEKIQHDFEFNGRFYLINSGMISTDDFKTYRLEKISGYEDYVIRDVIFRDEKAYVLAGEQQKDGTYINAVFVTSDFENYDLLYTFEDLLFARSFEICGNYFYFGLGVSATAVYDEKKNIILPNNASDCGTIYRYKFK